MFFGHIISTRLFSLLNLRVICLLGANMPFLFCSLMDFAWFWLWY